MNEYGNTLVTIMTTENQTMARPLEQNQGNDGNRMKTKRPHDLYTSHRANKLSLFTLCFGLIIQHI